MDWLIEKLFGTVLPSEDVIAWLFDTYAWILKEHGGYIQFSKRDLLTPTNQDFPIDGLQGELLGQKLFEIVRTHAGLMRWPCRLELVKAHEDFLQGAGEMLGRRISSGAAATFQLSPEGTAVIRYSSDELNDAHALIATLAHELSHYFLSTSISHPPGGEMAMEPATDITAVFLGFGIFIANSAFTIREVRGINSSGFIRSQKGYLGEPTLAYALAIFSELHDLPPKSVQQHLKTNPHSFYASAVHDIRKRWGGRLNVLRQI